ncbi:RidA family protein [Pararhizobium mangrovi]|uniref:RidA family protein n=1 Tax=Pararhizobium mangrovi TaxID=2590452 RepID=A0A506UAV8_9HYPH|nr:RidA family protein [Pararhizobium mangrovi]TPW30658.1 RidA family protein [Pararhizobium mangrovi]
MHSPTSATASVATPEEALERLGLSLPSAPSPIGNFVNAVRVGDLLFVSGQGPVRTDGTLLTGKVGGTVSVEDAYEHARLVGLNLLAVIRQEVGDLSRIKRVVKIFGMVNAAPDFTDHPKVVNGCSDLFGEVLSHAGIHARSAVGMGSLPNDITVEIEAIVEIATK